MSFKREDRYVVFKRKDIEFLSEEQKRNLADISRTISVIRAERQVSPILECVIIESDWPEYEYVWGLIQHRMEVFGK